MPVVLNRFAPVALLTFACSGAFDKDSGAVDSADGDTDADTDTDEQGGGETDDLPDLKEGLDEGGCEDYQGTPIPGAASYFWGEFEPDGTGWTGIEEWILFANDAWVERGEGDCVVRWTSLADESSTGACGACDVGLAVEASLDASATTCPEDLYAGWESLDEEYAVALSSDGTNTWFFSGSGEQFASGRHEDGAMNYIGEKQCEWF